MTTVHWARHGENVANLSRIFSYRVFDGDLTERGIAQANDLADLLHASDRHYGLLVCSPLRRARQTAQIVSARLRLPVRAELDDLREINIGDLDGRSDEEAWQIYEKTLATWRSGQLGSRFSGGESGYELAARIARALGVVAEQAGRGHAVVVAHGANIRAALPALTGQPDPGYDLMPGALARFAVVPGETATVQVRLVAWT